METKEAIERHKKQCEEMRPKYGDGPWKNEPDRVEFKHLDLHCLLSRNPYMGNWCGYVGVPKEHPAYSMDKDEIPVEVHGGLTYAEHCDEVICHITEEEDALYWVGFDCAHCWDLTPFSSAYFKQKSMTSYRTMEWAIEETKRLAEQLVLMQKEKESKTCV